MKSYLSCFPIVNIDSTVDFVNVWIFASNFDVLGEFIFLLLQDCDSCFESNVLLHRLIQILL